MIKEVTILRDEELRRRFSDIIDSGINRSYYTWDAAVHILAQQPAPRFYLCPKKAQQYVYAMRRGEHMVHSPLCMQMVKDLSENFDRIKEAKPYLKMKEVWNEVVESPAKSFYLSENWIKQIVYDYIRTRQNQSRV